MKSDRRFQHGPNGTYMDTTYFSFDEADRNAPGPIIFENKGCDLVKTNYFDSTMGSAGLFYLSANAGVVRLLIPDNEVHRLSEMKTGKLCVITSGLYQGRSSVEIMFDDGTGAPFTLYVQAGQCDFGVGRDRTRGTLTAWTRSGKVGEWPAHQRVGRHLPNLKPWK